MKILISIVLCNAIFAVHALPTQMSRADIEQSLKTKLLAAICSLKGKAAESCIHDVRMQNGLQQIIDIARQEGRLSRARNNADGVTSSLLGHLISQKQRRQSSFYSNW
ncbi:uncharacterized protein LOC135462797 [Liolophura sinensis]|uniref:uncharacterized protein LOC135462797 n=1 Tax=Liolophura sinensis TaxID=3198878 RepID=UPI0031580F37